MSDNPAVMIYLLTKNWSCGDENHSVSLTDPVTFAWGMRTLVLKFSLANIILDKWRSKFAKTKWWGSVNDTEWFSSPHDQFLVSRYIITAGLSDIPVLFDYVPFCTDARKEAHQNTVSDIYSALSLIGRFWSTKYGSRAQKNPRLIILSINIM
jgi:hypothetical protein